MTKKEALKEIRELDKKNKKLIHDFMGEYNTHRMKSISDEIRTNSERIVALREVIRTNK